MKRAFLKKFFIIAFSFALLAFLMPRLSADEDTSQINVIDMVTGDIQTVAVNNLTRVSVTSPEIADIADAKSDKVSVLAKKAGETDLFLWDAGGKRSIKVRVVNEDLSAVKARVEKVLEEANITGISLEENLDISKVVVSGAIPKEDKNRLENILQPYSDNLLNLVKEEKNEDLIQVDMQIIEIQTSFEKDLGVLWGNPVLTTGSSSGGSTTSGLLTETENLPSTNGNGKIGDFFKIGSFSRSGLQATVNAFIQEGKARLISKPRLVVLNGKQASFLVGGEIPTINTTTNATGTSQTTSTNYSQYGVNVTVTPTIREGKIDVLLNVDIRDIDAANSTAATSSSSAQTAFITRTASTDLFMDNKQTIVLAGLIKYSDNEQVTRVPFLSSIPLVGALFRNRSTPSPDSNTEMVIILTPMVLADKKFADKQVVMPTPSQRDSWEEINARYEHEPLLSSWPAAKEVTPKEEVTPVDSTKEEQPAAVDLPVMTAYARMVQERISKAISYPNAVGKGGSLAGTVKLKLHILKNGSLGSAEVMESSGNYILDQAAMQAAKTAAPYDVFTTGMNQEGMIFTIPIIYNNLISGGAQAPSEKVIASY
jgi:pilus assembly protein CpaC